MDELKLNGIAWSDHESLTYEAKYRNKWVRRLTHIKVRLAHLRHSLLWLVNYTHCVETAFKTAILKLTCALDISPSLTPRVDFSFLFWIVHSLCRMERMHFKEVLLIYLFLRSLCFPFIMGGLLWPILGSLLMVAILIFCVWLVASNSSSRSEDDDGKDATPQHGS